MKVYNPANGKIIANLPTHNIVQLKKQIDDSEKAFADWAQVSGFERAKLLIKWHDLIIKNKSSIAKVMTSESGKLPEEALMEVDYAASFISWSAEEAKRITGEVLTMPNSNKGYVIKQAVGVVGAITPWNFPAAMITRKTAPALAAGCTVIIKPSSETPLTAIKLVELAHKAGFPKNVIQLVLGDSKTIGAELCANPKVRKISFTGSTEVGKILMSACADGIKKITLELGGNAPFIVFADADINKAIAGAIKSRFRFSGQTCICANRFLVHEKIADEFAKKLTAKIKGLKLAPLINQAAVKKVDGLLQSAINHGGKILCGGNHKGNFFEATVVAGLTPNCDIFGTEIFGPIATIFKFKNFAEAIKLANQTEYGLAAYIFGGSSAETIKAAELLDFGMIGVNDTTISSSHSPFGGMKQSGFGKEGSHFGIDEFLEKKYISIGSN